MALDDQTFPQDTSIDSTGAGANAALQTFITQAVSRDFAFSSKYRVTMPTIVGSGTTTTSLPMGDIDGRTFSLYCEQAALPGISFDTSSYHIYGPGFQRPSDVDYYGNGLTFVFMVDQNMSIRQYFESWMHLITEPSSYLFEYPDAFVTSGIVITQLKHRGQDLQGGTDIGVYSVRLIDAFPKTIDTMPLSYGSRDMHHISVQFAYSRWIPVYGDEDPPFTYESPTGSDTQQEIGS